MDSELLDLVADFLYLVYTVAYNNSYWASLYHNICKAYRRWAMVGKVIFKTGAMMQVLGML